MQEYLLGDVYGVTILLVSSARASKDQSALPCFWCIRSVKLQQVTLLSLMNYKPVQVTFCGANAWQLFWRHVHKESFDTVRHVASCTGKFLPETTECLSARVK